MATEYTLRARRTRLIHRIEDHMDFLIGTVSTKSLKTPAYNLTVKVDQVTKSRYIPKDLVPLVRRLTKRHKALKKLIKQLGDVNWELLKQAGSL